MPSSRNRRVRPSSARRDTSVTQAINNAVFNVAPTSFMRRATTGDGPAGTNCASDSRTIWYSLPEKLGEVGLPRLGYLLPTRERIMEGRPETSPLLALAERAEGLGFDSLWVGDSLLARPRHDALTLLAAVAARTRRP